MYNIKASIAIASPETEIFDDERPRIFVFVDRPLGWTYHFQQKLLVIWNFIIHLPQQILNPIYRWLEINPGQEFEFWVDILCLCWVLAWIGIASGDYDDRWLFEDWGHVVELAQDSQGYYVWRRCRN